MYDNYVFPTCICIEQEVMQTDWMQGWYLIGVDREVYDVGREMQ